MYCNIKISDTLHKNKSLFHFVPTHFCSCYFTTFFYCDVFLSTFDKNFEKNFYSNFDMTQNVVRVFYNNYIGKRFAICHE